MTNRFLMSVAAAALIAGTGFANAQGTGTGHETPSAEHAAPSSAAPMNHNPAAEHGAAPSGQKMQPPGNQGPRAEDDMKAGPKGEKSGEKSAQENNMKGEQPKGTSAQTDERSSAGKDMKAEGRDGHMKADSKGAMDNKSETVGQAGAGGKLSNEQRTKISTVIRGEHVQAVTNVNFSISVGTRVPRDVSFHPLPAEVVTYYPEWRGYEFILVNGQIIVVDPRSFEIVAIIDA
jgi:hypothetical protein